MCGQVWGLQAVQAVVNFKWTTWARNYLYYELACYLVWLLGFQVFTIIFQVFIAPRRIRLGVLCTIRLLSKSLGCSDDIEPMLLLSCCRFSPDLQPSATVQPLQAQYSTLWSLAKAEGTVQSCCSLNSTPDMLQICWSLSTILACSSP